MPLDTEVKGDPAALTALSQWCQQQSEGAEQAGSQIYSARGESESGWEHAAGEGFRAVMTAAGKMIDTEVRLLKDTVRALETHANDLRIVRDMMQDARDKAAQGGLPINGFQIEEPGPAPAAPAPLPQGSPVSPQQQHDHATATAAQGTFQAKATAYAQASQLVQDARRKESDSQHVLVRFLAGTFDPAKLAVTLTDMSTGMAAGTATRTSKAKDFAEAALTKAERASKLASSTHLSFANRAHAIGIQVTNEVNAKDALDQATASRAARVIDRFPTKVQSAIRAIDTKIVPNPIKVGNPVLKGATKFGSKLPVAGLVFTGIGVGVDVAGGKDPTQAAVGGGASFVSGALVGAAIGGPVGVVVGGVVGLGVGFAVDEFWPS